MAGNPTRSPPPALPPILYEAEGLIVVNKPVGLPSTGRDLEDRGCLQGLLMAHRRRMIWAVHQLDQGTSGVNLFVRRKALVATVGDALKQGEKTYLALCDGAPTQDRIAIDAPIAYDAARGGRWIHPEGKAARSDVEVLARGGGAALLKIRIATGRSHQIRIHLASLGHPLLGEDRYREPPCDRAPGPALHAYHVLLGPGPWGDALSLYAPLPASFSALAEALGLGHALPPTA